MVKAFNQETREIGRFDDRNRDVTDEFNRIHRMWTTFWPILMLGVHTTTVIVWAVAVPRLLGAQLSVGTFISFLLYATMFVDPIEIIGQLARTMNRATSSAHRVFEVLDTEPEVRDIAQPVRLEPVHGRVGFERVTPLGTAGMRLYRDVDQSARVQLAVLESRAFRSLVPEPTEEEFELRGGDETSPQFPGLPSPTRDNSSASPSTWLHLP